MRRRSKKVDTPTESLSPWLVRRVRSPYGKPLNKPRLWGKVWAISPETAIQKFVNTLGMGDNPNYFDAILWVDYKSEESAA